jgi:low temperature requirement protein LtrA
MTDTGPAARRSRWTSPPGASARTERKGPTGRTGRIVTRMTARDPHETHRVSTPLELFFDLCFVVAVAQAGAGLVHAVTAGHTAAGVADYLLAFFGVWWAWMNFTWFASAYDCDDVPYRLLTLLQMAGVLVFAAGVSRAFTGDWTLTVAGYVLMRLALTTQWLRAGRGATGPEARAAYRYAIGLVLCQAGWVIALSVPSGSRGWVFPLLVLAELSVPLIAERERRTPWHAHHIAERYGLFTIIVLGESVAAATVAVKSGLDEHHAPGTLIPTAVGGLLIVFAAWWIYFAVPAHTHLISNREAIPWGYGHYLVFAGAAAIGAGLEVVAERDAGGDHLPAVTANAAVTVPTAAYLVAVWLIHTRRHIAGGARRALLPAAALAVLACTYAGAAAVVLTGLVCAAATATVTLTRPPGDASPSDP